MIASVVDLRYHMSDILKALRRNEEVKILYRKKIIATIVPEPTTISMRVQDHDFFGLDSDIKLSVEEEMEQLRGGRYRDI